MATRKVAGDPHPGGLHEMIARQQRGRPDDQENRVKDEQRKYGRPPETLAGTIRSSSHVSLVGRCR